MSSYNPKELVQRLRSDMENSQREYLDRFVIVGGNLSLPYTRNTKHQLEDIFRPYGSIVSIRCVTTVHKKRDWALIEYENVESADNAIRTVDKKLVMVPHISLLRVYGAYEILDQFFNRCIMIYNLSPNTTDEDLRNNFQHFGTISSLLRSPSGHALLYYEERLAAMVAACSMNGYSLGGSPIKVEFITKKSRAYLMTGMDALATEYPRISASFLPPPVFTNAINFSKYISGNTIYISGSSPDCATKHGESIARTISAYGGLWFVKRFTKTGHIMIVTSGEEATKYILDSSPREIVLEKENTTIYVNPSEGPEEIVSQLLIDSE